jgi:UDP-N-acetylmuramate--alanine ligase
MTTLEKITFTGTIHMIGIGGVGVSALAKFLVQHESVVTGSDLGSSAITDALINEYKIPVTIGSNPEVITSNYDYLVYSPAIKPEDPERVRARELGIPEYSYPQVLGAITDTKKTITVSGTNGKTTTTTMIIELLDFLGTSPSGIVGEILPKFNSNYIHGESDIFIAEACEYRDSFLNLHHDAAVITNISLDHLDYFRDLEHIQSSFVKYLENRKGTGCLITNTDAENLQPVVAHARELGMHIIPYQAFLTDNLVVSLPGEHNRQNAAAALAVVDYLNLDIDKAREYLRTDFKGAQRRLEFIGTTALGSLVYDDYAHNPEGIEFLIKSLKDRYPEKNTVIIFEPHLYSRTRDFKEAFAQALSHASHVFLFPTYRAREPENEAENYLLAGELEKISANFNIPPTDVLFKDYLDDFNFDENTVIVTAGAGPIWKVGRTLINN